MMYEAIIYDEQDRNESEPSSLLGWVDNKDAAISSVLEYIGDTSGIYRGEVRDRYGKLIWEWNKK